MNSNVNQRENDIQFSPSTRNIFYASSQEVLINTSIGKLVLLLLKLAYTGTIGIAATILTYTTESIGKAIAVLTFDQIYEENRNKMMITRKKNPVQGFKDGCYGLVKSFVCGVTAVFTCPITAFSTKKFVFDGLKGFGRGCAGLLFKPLCGMFDYVSSILNLLSNCDHKKNPVQPIRRERCFYFHGRNCGFNKIEMEKYHFFKMIIKSEKCLSEDKFVNGEFFNSQFIFNTNKHVVVAQIQTFSSFEITKIIEISCISELELQFNILKMKRESEDLEPYILSFETESIAEAFVLNLCSFVNILYSSQPLTRPDQFIY